MNLIIDIGNTRAKAVVMNGLSLVESFVQESSTREWLEAIVHKHPAIRRAIVSSTRGDAALCCRELSTLVDYVVEFQPAATPIPIGNSYHTPQTLGADRLAAAVGAAAMYPDCDLLVVDFGTAITIDFVEGGSFRGGNISPGVTTRFRSLADYTACLPLCSATDEVLAYGRTTREAIEQGVMRGVEQEIRGYCDDFSKKNGEKRIIFTGGDAKYFAMRIKNAIFADCEPVIFGLNTILNYNAENEE
ncbi:MAG: type III pantothenate kinase [Alistipes sp.]|nr:type III pantothenate kinase [Alistipes sp.]